MPRPLARRLDGSRRIRLDDVDPADTQGIEKDEALERIEKLGRELSELENLLTYAGTQALLVVLQGRDASGKDGTIRKILGFSNIQHELRAPVQGARPRRSARTTSCGAPTRRSRGAATMALFNRSHYEDVLAARVHRLVPRGDLESALRRTSTRSSGCSSETPTSSC